MSTSTLPRNATRIRVHLPDRVDTMERAIRAAVQHAIGDYEAKVSLRQVDDDGGCIVIVKQAHATWWTDLPDTLAELMYDYDERFTLRWNGSEPPAEVE